MTQDRLTFTIPQALPVIAAHLDARHPVMLWGAAGIGKSDAVRQVAASRAMPCLDVRAAQFDAVDLRGLPSVQDGATVWNVPAFLPHAERHGAAGILFLDELTNARLDVQAALYQLVLDRRLGDYALPDGWHIVAAGNRVADRAAATRMSSALANRIGHLEMVADLDAWCAWAAGAGLSPALIAYLRFRPDRFCDPAEVAHKAEPPAFATPRSWTRCNAFLSLPPAVRVRAIAANVGLSHATDLEAFLRAYAGLRDLLPAILSAPGSAPIPAEPSLLHAVTAAIARKASVDSTTWQAVATYAARLPGEYETATILDATRRAPALRETRPYLEWCARNPGVEQ